MRTIVLKAHGWGGGLRTQWDLVARHLGPVVRHATPARVLNVLQLGYEMLRRTRHVGARPVVVKVEPTNVCNFRCPGCRTGSGQDTSPRGALDLDNFKKIIDRTYRHAFKVILYMWGEPLINKDIFAMIRYARSKNLATQISSNMNVFRPGYAEALVDAGLEQLIVAFDGATQETYQVYRVNGQLQKVMDNVRAVLEARRAKKKKFPQVELQFIAFPHNQHEVPQARAMAAELGVDRFTIIQSLSNTNKARAKTGADGRPRQPDKCNALYMMACFNWDGSFSPCCDSVDDSFGNILEQPLAALWNSPKMQKSRSLHTANPIEGGPAT